VWSQLDLVFDNGIGEPLSPWTVSADFRRVVAELGLPRTRFHDLRHAHATQLLSAGVHVKAVSERLGHSSTSFTMDTYAAVMPSMGRAAADAADQLFGEERGKWLGGPKWVQQRPPRWLEEGVCAGRSRAPGRNRTCDSRFRKPLLSPLSYEGVLGRV
jgi:hypothetical protein